MLRTKKYIYNSRLFSATRHRDWFNAAIEGDLATLRLLLPVIENINMLDSNEYYKRTALCHAAANGHDVVVQFLIDRGANIQNDRALIDAARYWQSTVVVLLLGAGVIAQHIRDTALVDACEAGAVDIVSKLLDAGADVNFHEGLPLGTACRSGRADTVALLMGRGANLALEDEDGSRNELLSTTLWHLEQCTPEGQVRAIQQVAIITGSLIHSNDVLAFTLANANLCRTALSTSSKFDADGATQYFRIARLLVEAGLSLEGFDHSIQSVAQKFPDVGTYLVEQRDLQRQQIEATSSTSSARRLSM